MWKVERERERQSKSNAEIESIEDERVTTGKQYIEEEQDYRTTILFIFFIFVFSL